MNTTIPVLIVGLSAALLSYRACREAAEKGMRIKGLCLAGVVGLVSWALLAQGFSNEWPAAVGWLAFLVGAFEALTTRKKSAVVIRAAWFWAIHPALVELAQPSANTLQGC